MLEKFNVHLPLAEQGNRVEALVKALAAFAKGVAAKNPTADPIELIRSSGIYDLFIDLVAVDKFRYLSDETSRKEFIRVGGPLQKAAQFATAPPKKCLSAPGEPQGTFSRLCERQEEQPIIL